MTDPLSILKSLERPKILIRAARYGVANYCRNRDLKRLLPGANLPTPGQGIMTLLAEEGDMEELRKTGDASYSITRHISVLVAMMAEAKLLPVVR